MTSSPVQPWSLGCLLNSFYIVANYAVWRRDEMLHWVDLPLPQPPCSLLLYDYSFRHHLDLTCVTQLVRTVSATRYVAAAFDQWSADCGSTDMNRFAREVLGPSVPASKVHDMVQDGRRLHRLEIESADVYASLVVALDWHRFQVTSDGVLIDLVRGLFTIPAAQALLLQLSMQWPLQWRRDYDGMDRYWRCGSVPQLTLSGQVQSFDQMPKVWRLEWSRPLRVNCSACYLFLQPEKCDYSLCVTCRRTRSGPGSRCDSREHVFAAQLASLVQRLDLGLSSLLRVSGGQPWIDDAEAASEHATEQEQLVRQVKELDKKLSELMLRVTQRRSQHLQQHAFKRRRQPGRRVKLDHYRPILPRQAQIEAAPSVDAGQAVEIQPSRQQSLQLVVSRIEGGTCSATSDTAQTDSLYGQLGAGEEGEA